MANYSQPGAAVLRCDVCGDELRVEWVTGDPPIFVPEHCGQPRRQATHNDGLTPIEEPCPSHCCP